VGAGAGPEDDNSTASSGRHAVVRHELKRIATLKEKKMEHLTFKVDESAVTREDGMLDSLADWRDDKPQEEEDLSSYRLGPGGRVVQSTAGNLPFSHEAYKQKVLSKKHNPDLRPVNAKTAGRSFLHPQRRLKIDLKKATDNSPPAPPGVAFGSKSARY